MAEKKIGKDTFRVQPLPASRAVELGARLIRVAGPAIAELRDGGEEAFARALSSLSRTMDPKEVTNLIVEMAEQAEISHEGSYMPVIFDQHFTGRLQDAFQLVAFVVQTEFGDFLSDGLASPSIKKVGTKG